MKVDTKNTDTKLALRAMNRAASKVLNQAVEANEAIPLWDGEKIVWKVPQREAQELAAEIPLREPVEK